MIRPAIMLLLLLAPALVAAEPWRRHTIDDASRGADGVRLADANGDGLADIATGWEEGGQIRVYLNPGPAKSRGRWPAVTAGQVASPEDAVLVDLDGDGALDVVSCCEGRNKTVFIHWAPPAPRYLQAAAWTTRAVTVTARQQSWMFALPLQVDGRGGVDLVVGSKGSNATIGWLAAPGDPRDPAQWQFHPLYQAGWIMSLQAHDMDGDGDLDVLASDRKGPTRGVLWLENPGPPGTGPWRQHRVGGGDREVMFLTLADLDQDGRRDIVTAVRGGPLAWFRPPAAGQTAWQLTEIPLPAGCGTGKGVAVGDVDRDGRNDLVFSCENARGALSGVRWLSPPTPAAASWQDHEISGPQGVKFDRLELLDLDADGDLDVLTCEESHNLGVFWYENPTR